MQIIPIVLSSIVAPILFMLLTYWMDRRQPEPLLQLLKAMSLGGVVALLSLSFTSVLNYAEWINVGDITLWNHLKQAFLGAALPEEMSKLIMLWILLKNNKYFDEFLDGVVYAVFIAMGFAAVENICYALTNPMEWDSVIMGRSILSVPAHFCYAAVMGTCYSFWRFRGERMYICLTIIIPVLLHGVFDLCLNEMTPGKGQAYLVVVGIVLVILLLLMVAFVYMGISSTIKVDVTARQARMHNAWKGTNMRSYTITLLLISSTMLLNGETVKNSKGNACLLSSELKEFRDAFCLKLRNAYVNFEKSKNAESLEMDLMEALCNYDDSAYFANQEFALNKYKIRLLPFSEMKIIDDSNICSTGDEHICFNPYRVSRSVQMMYEMKIHDNGMMYEIIHNINKWSTDGSASIAQLPRCKYMTYVLKAHSNISMNYNCYGKQELLLVTENGGNCHLTLKDMTQNKNYTIEKNNGAEWVTWTMKTQGDCNVTISNPTDRELSFVLATIEKNK